MAVKRIMGMTAKATYDSLLEEYEADRRTLQNDWSRRDEWLPELFEFEDMDAFVAQLISEQQFIKQRLWAHYDDAETPEVKRRILSDIRDMGGELLEMMQDLGKVYREPDKVDVDLSTVDEETGEVIDAALSEISSENGEADGALEESFEGEAQRKIPEGQEGS